MFRKAMAVVGMCVAATAAFVAVSPAASADSRNRWVYEEDGRSDRDCGGQWLSADNKFRLVDSDLFDDDWCYIDFSFKADLDPTSRVQTPQDVSNEWVVFPVDNPEGDKWIFFKVCQERQDDPDLCTKWGQFLT